MNCEQLGVRINPANQTFYWIGTEFTEASSWFQTVGTTNTEIPGYMDHIVLGVTPSGSGPMIDGEPTSLVPSNANCTVPVAIAFGSIRVKIDYSATLSVKDDTSAGYLELRNGVLDQVGENDDFTVTTTMDFTGGAINSTGPRGILHLATPALTPNTIGGAANTTVTMGSILEVNGNALLVYTNGTIAFKNGSYFDSLGGSTITASNLSGASGFTNIGETNNPHLIQGNFTLKSNSDQAFLVKAGGHLQVVKTVEIAGRIDPGVNTSVSLGMTGGTITATNSIELKATNGFAMNGGTFKTTNLGSVANNFTLLLNGHTNVTGGSIELSHNSIGGDLGALSVIGNVSFTGGTYFAKIVGDANSLERHRWISTGTFTTTAGATITPIVSSGTLAASDPRNPRYWNIITADLTIPVASVLPTVPLASGFTGVLSMDRKQFDLKW